MWQHEDSIADLQDTVPQPPLWRSPSTVMHVLGGDNHPASMNNHLDNSCVMGMSSEVGGISMMSMSSVSDLPLNDLCDNDVNDSYGGAVAAFQDDDDFRATSNRNFLFPRKFNIAPLHELQQQRQQHHQDYVSMFQKMDVHDASMRNMMMMQHQQQQQQYHYEHEPVHQMSLRQHLSYGASFQQQQQHQEFHRTMNAPSIPFIDTQRRVRRPRRKSAPTANPGNTCDDLTSGDEQQLQQQLRRATFSASNHNKTFQNDEQFQLNRLLATFDD